MEWSRDGRSREDPAVESIVLAGGFSRRFGDREKLTAPVGDEPMLRRVVRTVEPLSRQVVVNCRREQRGQFEEALDPPDARSVPVTFSFDDPPDGGPLAGLATAIDAVDADAAIVIGGDLPLVRTDALAALLSALGEEFGGGGDESDPESVDAALPSVDGRLQPLCAACRTPPLRTELAAIPDPRDRPVVAAFDDLSIRTVPASRLPGGETSFGNVNTPGDRREVTRLLEGRSASATGSRNP